MWLSEARADIPIHLMGPNPGPGHGGMSCASPSKPTFSMAWRHNRNAKNAQSRAKIGKSTGCYNERARVEGQFARWKQVIGDGLRFHSDEARATEVAIAAQVLNRMLDLGRPNSVRVA